MTENKYIELGSLTLEELASVINIYPWYGSARKELCRRMSQMGQEAWDKEQYVDSAMYVADRRIIATVFGAGSKVDLSDKELERILKSFIEETPQEPTEEARQVHVVGGDYFSQSQYNDVRTKEDSVFSRFAVKPSDSTEDREAENPLLDDCFCTEPLAQIFAEQGYLEQAKHIYSRLLLKNPEKSAYFAALIENLKE